MINYTKKINSLESYKSIDGLSDVVFNIQWTLVGEEDQVTGSCPANTFVPYIAGQSFTPYSELTPQQINNWIDVYTPILIMQQYKATVDLSIYQQKQVVTPPIPWEPPPVDPNITPVNN